MTLSDRIAVLLEQLDTEGSLAVAGLGDSLTDGWGVRRGFFERFCDVLEQRHDGSVVSRRNAGVPGDTARGGLARVGAVLASQPDVLIVQFGINDMWDGEPIEDFEASLSSIVRAAERFSVLPVLVTSCPLPLPSDQLAIEPYYAAIHRVAQSQNTPCADLCAHWIAHHGWPRDHGGLFLSDGVHPSEEGHAILAEGLLSSFSRDTWIAPGPQHV